MFYVNFKTMKMKNVKMRIANQFAKSIPVVVLCALFNACGNDDSTESFSGKTTNNSLISKPLLYYWTLIGKMMNRDIAKIVSLIVILCLTGCGGNDVKDDETLGFTTINMMNELNGKTYLDNTGIYINKTNNFTSQSWYIVDVDSRVKVIKKDTQYDLGNLTYLAAVQYKHWFEAYNPYDIIKFPSGKNAICCGAIFYKFYPVSSIQEDGIIKGAVVKYSKLTANSEILPPKETSIGKMTKPYDNIEYKIPENTEFLASDYLKAELKYFDIQLKDGKLKIRLKKYVDKQEGPYGDYIIYLRYGTIYTSLVFHVTE